MGQRYTIDGIVSTGRGLAATWIPDQDWTPLNIIPFPGTLNIAVSDEAVVLARSVDGVAVREVKPSGRRPGVILDVVVVYIPLWLSGVPVWGRAYTRNIELVAEAGLRDLLGLVDGDRVVLESR